MQFHDHTDDINKYGRFREKEEKWSELIKKAETNQSWTTDEIEFVLYSIQDFLFGDFPQEREIPVEKMRSALDHMTRVALARKKESEPGERRYITTKLCIVLKELQRD
jgi:hypothetical protein